jgi:GntR family transcriptional regulator
MGNSVSFHVDPRSPTPIYDQISSQVKHACAAGTLRRGDILPSVRQMAVSLRVNPNTVARAYRELEAEGVVESRKGQGTFVAETGRRLTAAARRKALAPGAMRLAGDAHALGLARDELMDVVGEGWDALADRRADQANRRDESSRRQP